MKQKQPLYTVQHTNEFAMNLIHHNRCGGAGNVFHYEVTVKSRDLDAQNFVFDGDKIVDAFAHYGRGLWRASCEDIAAGMVRILHREMKGRAVHITARIFPSRVRYIEVEWNAGEALPTNKPIRVDKNNVPRPKKARTFAPEIPTLK